MARIKKSSPQRQPLESLRTRTLSITPIHRESIINPNYTCILPMASATMADTTASANGMTRTRKTLQKGTQMDDNSGWMTKWCVEPRGDISACFTATLVPCVLYGKIDWRLRRVALGEDASDKSWNVRMGCNAPCWIYVVLDLILPRVLISGILVGLQRSQIRGVYDIPGSVSVDCARGLFCPICTLVHNDREVRAREGQKSLRNNKQYVEALVTEQPRLNPRMQPPWVSSIRPNPRPTSDQPMEMTQTNALIGFDDVDGTAAHRGGHEKTRAWSPRKKSQEHSNKATIMESAREYHLKSEHSQINATAKVERTTTITTETAKSQTEQNHNTTKAETEIKTIPDVKSERSDGWKRSPIVNLMPIVIVTGPQDSKPARRVPSVPDQTEQTGSLSVQDMNPLSKDHTLMDCPIVETIEGVDSRTDLQTHRLVDCTTAEEIQKRKLNSHGLAHCKTITESSTAVQHHTLADCNNSNDSENQDLSYVHDFADCPVDKAVLEYCDKEETSVQSHVLAECARRSSAGNARPRSEIPQHNLVECARSSMDSPYKVTGNHPHNLRDCLGGNSASTLVLSNPYLEHSLADCPNDDFRGPTVRSDKQYRSTSGTADSTSKNTHRGVQHRLSSCPTPIARSGKRSSDDSQAMQTPTNLSITMDQSNTNVGSGSGTSSSYVKDAEGRAHNRRRRRHKGKGKANGNATKTIREESSRPAELSAQQSLQRLLLTADGKRENDGASAALLKPNLYVSPEGNVQDTLYVER